jgi:hypothetical protein
MTSITYWLVVLTQIKSAHFKSVLKHLIFALIHALDVELRYQRLSGTQPRLLYVTTEISGLNPKGRHFWRLNFLICAFWFIKFNVFLVICSERLMDKWQWRNKGFCRPEQNLKFGALKKFLRHAFEREGFKDFETTPSKNVWTSPMQGGRGRKVSFLRDVTSERPLIPPLIWVWILWLQACATTTFDLVLKLLHQIKLETRPRARGTEVHFPTLAHRSLTQIN